jgi:hypothetical protein
MSPSASRQSSILAIAVLIAMGGCDSSRLSGPRDVARLNAAEARWLDRPFEDYRYEIRTSCFCGPDVTRWTRVTVQGGAVVAAEPVEPDPALPVTSLEYWQPIDSLFARLRRALVERESGEFYAAIVAEYDPALGYPVLIEYRAQPYIADGGATHWLRNVVPY